MFVSSARLGAWFKRRGLLDIPEEVHPPAIVEAYRNQLEKIHALGAPPRKDIFRRFLESPALLRAHIDALRATREYSTTTGDNFNRLADRVTQNQWDKITTDEKRSVLIDPPALTALHEQLWRTKTYAEPLHI
jgi:membrane glycosyltransferase